MSGKQGSSGLDGWPPMMTKKLRSAMDNQKQMVANEETRLADEEIFAKLVLEKEWEFGNADDFHLINCGIPLKFDLSQNWLLAGSFCARISFLPFTETR